ncbi:MAG: hypothetical protein JEZ07_02255 [Phycisphaerae bacterium]|nr:hypothetical protein [Phycisphaerae bacterium]
MAVTIMCPNLRCRKILVVPRQVRGTRVRCAYCKTMLAVPMAKPLANAPVKTKEEPKKEKSKK